MMSRLSIRARITLGSVLVAVIVFGIALIAIRAQVAGVLDSADSTLATSDLVAFAADIRANPDEGVDDPGPGVLVYIRDPSGDVAVDTLPDGIADSIGDRPSRDVSFEARSGGVEYRVVGETVSTPDGEWILWAARSSETAALAVGGLDRLLAVGGAVLLVAFGIASWLLATAALRPVTRLRRQAEQLAELPETATLPVGTANDEIADLARTLNDFLESVRASTDRERQVVSDAAHELRTPLAALKTQLEFVAEDLKDPRLAEAQVSVERISALATNLLELSRIDAGADSNRRAATAELESELMSSIDRIRMTPDGAVVDIDFELADGRDGDVALSAVSFGRLVDNLLSNAVAAGSRRVFVRLGGNADSILLEVDDDGPGMPPEFIHRAFERFSRPDEARSPGGSGLGLALVRATATSAGGTVSLVNTGSGLRATVTLPKV